MYRLLALCATCAALHLAPPRRIQRTVRRSDNGDVSEADVRTWMENVDVDELLDNGIDIDEVEERELPEMKLDRKEYDASPYVGESTAWTTRWRRRGGRRPRLYVEMLSPPLGWSASTSSGSRASYD